jgi:putative nucleotidyltransferase with HDIG domain
MLHATPHSGQELEQIIHRVERLRPLPTSATRILRALEDARTTAQDIAELLGLDQALTAYILQMANSASLGYGVPCSSLVDAVVRLGFKRVGGLVMTTVAAGPLSRRLSGYRIGDGELWNHSVSTATLAQYIARAVHYQETEEAYIAGLLHDIGKLLLDQYVFADYQHMAALMRQKQMRLWQVEQQMLGIDHSMVGALMATKWGFPSGLVEAIRHHHVPSLASGNARLSAVVHIADTASPRYTSGLVEQGEKLIHPSVLKILSVEQPALERILAKMIEYMKFGNPSGTKDGNA